MESSRQGLALICCDGGQRRMLALARALRHDQGMRVLFAVKEGDAGMFRLAGFASEPALTGLELAALARAHRPQLLILDKASSLSRGELEALRRHCLLIAAVEESSDLRLACDFAYYPPLPHALALDWTGARTVPRLGWEWTLLADHPALPPVRTSRPSLLIAMGDHGDLARRAARALSALDSSFRIRFVIGAGMADAARLAANIVAINENYETVEGADDFSTEYASADLALCAFGDRAFALAAFGVPAIWLASDGDQTASAMSMAAAGMGLCLGMADQAGDAQILEAVKALMNDAVRRREMRDKCLATMDGLGASRIAADLAEALAQENAPLRVAR